MNPNIAGKDPTSTVRIRSYYIWLEEGRPHGRDLDHWLRAESELKAGQAPKQMKPPVKPKPKAGKTSRKPAKKALTAPAKLR